MALFAPMLLRGEVLYWGTPLLQFIPWRTAALQALAAGHWPLWNPLLGMGAPLLANYQVGVFYPPHLLLPVLGPAWGSGVLVMLHLVWAGWGTVVLARRLDLGPAAQTVAALGFSLSGYLVARAGFFSINAAAAWLPWGVWAADRLGQAAALGARRRGFAAAAATLGLILGLQLLAGHAQTAAYSLILVGGWVLGRAYAAGKLRACATAAGGAAAALVLGLGLSAVQILPTAEYLAESARQSGVDPALAMTYSFWPWRLVGFLLPNLFGSPVRGDYWGYGNFWEDAVYVGVLPLVMALVAAVLALSGRGEKPALGRALLGLAAVSTLFAMGANTPIFPFLFRWVPGFDLFQAPARWMIVPVFGVALLAGIGVEAWRPPTGRALYWTRLGTAGAGGIALVALVSRGLIAGLRPSFAPAFALAGALLAAVGILSLVKGRLNERLWTAAVCALVLVDLVIAGWGLNPSTGADLYAGTSRLPRQVDPAHRIYMAADVVYDLKFGYYFRFDQFDEDLDRRAVRDSGIPNVGMLDGLASADNFDPLLADRFVSWMEALEKQPLSQRTSLLRLMDVGAVVDSAAELPAVTYMPVPEARRVRLVGQAVWAASPDEALQRTTADGFDPEAAVVLEGEPLPAQTAEPGATSLEIVDGGNPNRVTVTAASGGGGWLVLSDTWYPGWVATIDGQITTIYRADFLFRAVPVPAGQHTIVFDYRPLPFRLGAGLSLGAVALLLLAGWRWRRG